MGHHHHPHDLIGHCAAVRQSHPDAQTPRDVDHLSKKAETDGKRDRERLKVRVMVHVYYDFSGCALVLSTV